jgi:hypothetical protein
MKRKDSKRRWRSGLLPALALALGALVLAGCGGSGGGSSSTSESSPTAGSAESEASRSEGFGAEGEKGGPGIANISEEAKTCLKEKGVELPEFKGGEGGPPSGEPPEGAEGGPPEGGFGGEGSEKMQKAFEECGVELGEFKGGPGGNGAPDASSPAFKKQITKYAACVRENGYELAEPNFSGEGPIFEKSESESAAFKKASAKCQSLLGGPGGSGSEGEGGT